MGAMALHSMAEFKPVMSNGGAGIDVAGCSCGCSNSQQRYIFGVQLIVSILEAVHLGKETEMLNFSRIDCRGCGGRSV